MKSVDIRISKKDAAFVYAIMESWEGLAAFGTMDPHSADDAAQCRIRMWTDPSREEDFTAQLPALAASVPLEIMV
jgi:hypothetical protein